MFFYCPSLIEDDVKVGEGLGPDEEAVLGLRRHPFHHSVPPLHLLPLPALHLHLQLLLDDVAVGQELLVLLDPPQLTIFLSMSAGANSLDSALENRLRLPDKGMIICSESYLLSLLVFLVALTHGQRTFCR